MSVNVAEVFGQDVFNEAVMKERLPEVTYKQMVKLMNEGGEVTLELADIVAKAMKEWAIEKGATHYTHIFQPYIVSIGAEKHDSFADIPKGGKIENCFSGKDLMMGEPDASSFPSGGLRATCAARGYTAWDVGSPAYVKDGILCIPTAFCSYTGESLDTKTPLLKACDAVSKAGVRFVKMFGNTDAKRVSSYVGPEQEYFIVNREKYLERPDLIYAGRTLFGAPAPKGQEMEDQYFGPLKTKIADFMADVDEFYNLGIGDPVPVSASSRLGIGDMLDEVVKHFPETDSKAEEDDRPKIAIVGKPNVGKSSIINKLVGENRVIVSNIAGTTRDAIDTDIKWNGKEYVFIDTARGTGALQYYPYSNGCGTCRCGRCCDRCNRRCDGAGCQDCGNRP